MLGRPERQLRDGLQQDAAGILTLASASIHNLRRSYACLIEVLPNRSLAVSVRVVSDPMPKAQWGKACRVV